MYTVWRVSQRLSGVSPDRRPRVRIHLSRSDRRGVEPPVVRTRALGRPPLRLESVRRLPGRLPRQDRYPGPAPPSARPGGRAPRGRAPRARAAGVMDLRGGAGANATVSAGAARGRASEPQDAGGRLYLMKEYACREALELYL